MSEPFDPYHKWLGIPSKDQPPHHYRLLGIELFESDADVITHAADQRMGHLKAFHAGRHADVSQQLLNHIAAAKLCLLNREAKAEYDGQLRDRLEAELVEQLPATTSSPNPSLAETANATGGGPAAADPTGRLPAGPAGQVPPAAATSGADRLPAPSARNTPVLLSLAGLAVLGASAAGYLVVRRLDQTSGPSVSRVSPNQARGQVPVADARSAGQSAPVARAGGSDPVPLDVAPATPKDGTAPAAEPAAADGLAEANPAPAPEPGGEQSPDRDPADTTGPAEQANLDDSLRWAALERARAEAIQRRDLDAALAAVAALAQAGRTGPLADPAAVLAEILQAAKKSGDRQLLEAIVQHGREMLAQTLAAGRADLGERMAAVVLSAARLLDDPKLVREVTLLIVELQELAKPKNGERGA